MSRNITAANAVIMLAISGLYDSPQQLQGFSTDNIFETDALVVAETLMGVDGVQSAGEVNNPVVQNIELQADSASNDIFDQWVLAMKIGGTVYQAHASILLTSISKKWVGSYGVLTSWPPTPPVRKILQPRRYTISWESMLPQNV